MPPTSATLNNGALSHVTLFRISGQKAELDQAVQLLDKAAALTPDDSMLMINAGETNLTRALAEILDSYVHLEVLSIESDLDVLRFLYEDASGREAIVEQLRSSPQLARAVQLLERAVLLAPKRAENYTSLLELYAYQDDAAGLKRLQQRIEEVHPDVARQRQEAIDWAAGKEREDRLQRVIAGEANCRQLYDRWKSEPAGAKRDRSLAIAAGQLAMFALGRETLGDKVDLDEAIKLAEEGVELTPTSAGRFRLIYLLQSRAHEELAAQLPAYGQYAAAARPVLSPSLTLLLALEHESLRAAICEHPDMRRSADLYAQERQRFPQSPSTWDWFVLRYSHAEQAESIRTATLADECDRLSGEIQVRLFPFSVNAVLLRHAHLACAGKDVEARQLWKNLRDEGIPIQDDVLLP